jgi:nucleoside-diphosphate-sugar epimerase
MQNGAAATERLRGRRVLVTGGLGFIGLNLTSALLAAGAQVRILNRSAHPLALNWLGQIANGHPVELCQGDIADGDGMRTWLAGADVVVNLAGESGAVKSLHEARSDMQVNVAGHLTLLDAVRSVGRLPRIVFVSSRLVYGVTGATPAAEERPPRPTSLYGLHKLTVEHYHRIYWEQYGIPSTILRLTNPYGPFQLPHRLHYGVVNRFIMTAIQGGTITLFGGGGQLRDYIHAEDVAEALLRACVEERAVGEVLNVGSGVSVGIGEVARRIVAAAGAGSIEHAPWPEEEQKVETGDFLCDTSRVQEILGWQARTDLDDGLRQTVRCYRSLFA